MLLQPRLKQGLESARNFSESLLAAFQTPEQWTFQVHPQANHAMWFAGHIGFIDNVVVGALKPELAVPPPAGYQERFGIKSRPTSDPGQYPSPAEVHGFMRDRRQALLAVLDQLNDEDLAQPAPKGSPPMLTDVASAFDLLRWHEGMHAGQITVARRALGFAPLFGGDLT